MTPIQVLQWIKTNLGPIIHVSINMAKVKVPGLPYTEDLLAAIAMRETGGKIAKVFPAGLESGRQLAAIAPLMRGDFSKRPADKEAVYHGYGFWQADIKSFPDFVASGSWKDPAKSCAKAIQTLEDKCISIQRHFPGLVGDPLLRATVAAYNCGEGNVIDVLTEKHDIDIRTTDKNYSKNVWEFRALYQTL